MPCHFVFRYVQINAVKNCVWRRFNSCHLWPHPFGQQSTYRNTKWHGTLRYGKKGIVECGRTYYYMTMVRSLSTQRGSKGWYFPLAMHCHFVFRYLQVCNMQCHVILCFGMYSAVQMDVVKVAWISPAPHAIFDRIIWTYLNTKWHDIARCKLANI